MLTEAVYMLYHVQPEDDIYDEDWKLIGVYDSEDKAQRAISRVRMEAGFRDHPESFRIDRCTLNQDHWTEGFVRAG